MLTELKAINQKLTVFLAKEELDTSELVEIKSAIRQFNVSSKKVYTKSPTDRRQLVLDEIAKAQLSVKELERAYALELEQIDDITTEKEQQPQQQVGVPDENLDELDDNSNTDFNTLNPIMAPPSLKELEFIPTFKGESDAVKPFVNAINLAKATFPTHEELILLFARTKIQGPALAVAESVDNLADLNAQLKSMFFKPVPLSVVLAQTKTLAPMRSADAYITKLRDLRQKITSAYLDTGIPHANAYALAERELINSMHSNCMDKRLKVVLSSKFDDDFESVIAAYLREFNPKFALSTNKNDNKKQAKPKKFDKNFKKENSEKVEKQKQYKNNSNVRVVTENPSTSRERQGARVENDY